MIFPEALDMLTRNPLATNDQDLFRLFDNLSSYVHIEAKAYAHFSNPMT
jgi:hypothetical protein